MTVRFKELAGSPVEHYGPEGMTAQRRILCDWEDRLAMVSELLGTGYTFGAVGAAGYPGRQRVVAVKVKVEPFQARPEEQGAFSRISVQLNSYAGQFALLTIDYELSGSDSEAAGVPGPLGGATVAYRVSTTVEQVVASQTGATASVPVIAHHVICQPVAQPPWEAIRASMGAVNRDTFLGAAAGNMLFASLSSDRIFTGVENEMPQYAWKIHYVFKEWVSPVPPAGAGGWNSYAPVGAEARRSADFSALFQFGRSSS